MRTFIAILSIAILLFIIATTAAHAREQNVYVPGLECSALTQREAHKAGAPHGLALQGCESDGYAVLLFTRQNGAIHCHSVFVKDYPGDIGYLAQDTCGRLKIEAPLIRARVAR